MEDYREKQKQAKARTLPLCFECPHIIQGITPRGMTLGCGRKGVFHGESLVPKLINFKDFNGGVRFPDWCPVHQREDRDGESEN